jgi:D-3-phosphoglycerate dehydrogenase / 2-oxoglutarate reductase
MKRKVAVIGDLFMLSSMFEDALKDRCKLFDLDITTHDFPWPDEAMEHGVHGQRR